MRKTRFERLDSPNRVALADRIADLALTAERKTGKPILYMTAWDISRALKEDPQVVRNALRLSYTAEFFDAYGYGFVAPGNGRSGAIYGYTLLYGKSTAAVGEATENLHDNEAKTADHLREMARDWEQVRSANGGNTKVGKHAGLVSQILVGAAASVEGVVP